MSVVKRLPSQLGKSVGRDLSERLRGCSRVLLGTPLPLLAGTCHPDPEPERGEPDPEYEKSNGEAESVGTRETHCSEPRDEREKAGERTVSQRGAPARRLEPPEHEVVVTKRESDSDGPGQSYCPSQFGVRNQSDERSRSDTDAEERREYPGEKTVHASYYRSGAQPFRGTGGQPPVTSDLTAQSTPSRRRPPESRSP